MKNIILYSLVFLCCGIFCAPRSAWSEQVDRDLYATVVVNPVFVLSLDNARVSFGFLKPGESAELEKDNYYNFVKCNSNKGKKWYLKLSVVGDVAGPEPGIPPGSFKWKIFRATGDGVPQEGWKPFTKEPFLVYTSGAKDATGEDVIVQFQYRLDLPFEAVGGVYSITVLYTMTDVV